MLKALCVAVGAFCTTPDVPPTPPAVDLQVPIAVVKPLLEKPSLGIDKNLASPKYWPSGCDVNPPDQYKPMYSKAARKYPSGLTQCELSRQGKQESLFNPKAVSPVGAIGIAQFLPGTAKDMGIDPWNPKESIMAQARYMDYQIGQWNPSLGNRTRQDLVALGLAGYNWGLGNVLNTQKRHGWTRWYDAFKHFPSETKHYIEVITKEEGPH